MESYWKEEPQEAHNPKPRLRVMDVLLQVPGTRPELTQTNGEPPQAKKVIYNSAILSCQFRRGVKNFS